MSRKRVILSALACVALLILFGATRPPDPAQHLADLLIIASHPEGDLRHRRDYPGRVALIITVASHDKATVERAFEIASRRFVSDPFQAMEFEDSGRLLYEIQYDVPFYWMAEKEGDLAQGKQFPDSRFGYWSGYTDYLEHNKAGLRNLQPYKAQILTQQQQEQAVRLFLRPDWIERLKVRLLRKLDALF